jgi:hypothetical protein
MTDNEEAIYISHLESYNWKMNSYGRIKCNHYSLFDHGEKYGHEIVLFEDRAEHWIKGKPALKISYKNLKKYIETLEKYLK